MSEGAAGSTGAGSAGAASTGADRIRLEPGWKSRIGDYLQRDLGIAPPAHGCLTHWAEQGVLLLNAVLTVEEGKAGAHAGKGWEGFTDHVVETLAREREGLVFLLWGSYAQKKGAVIDPRRHRVLKAPHPSPLSAHRGFIGCGHFSRANQYLEANGVAPIDWRLPPRSALPAD